MDHPKGATKVFRYLCIKGMDTQWRTKDLRPIMKCLNSEGTKTFKVTKKKRESIFTDTPRLSPLVCGTFSNWLGLLEGQFTVSRAW